MIAEPAVHGTLPPPTVQELVDRAQSLHAFLAEASHRTENDKRVSEDTMARIKSLGLHRLGQPRRFGGYAYAPSAMLQVCFELGRACASTSWCTVIANSNAWFASYWPLEVQKEIWDDSPDSLVCISGIPTGKCKVVEGGFEIWGSWAFASNADNSDWIIVGAPLTETEGAAPETAWFMVRHDELVIDPNSWNVAGMRGTGSKTLSRATPLFVPRRRMVKLAQVIQETTPGRAVPGNTIAAYNFSTLSGVTLVAPLLGAAQGALDWFVETMKHKVKTTLKAGAMAPVALTPSIQARVGDASSHIDAAMALLLSSLVPFEEKVAAGQTVSISERVRVRRDIGYAARQAGKAVNILMEGAGASAMSMDSPLQRFWRDINFGARHVTLDTDGIYTMFGQERFGLEPIGPH